MLQNGLIMSAFGAYLVAITADTGWSPGVVALGYAIVQLGNGFLAPLTGWCCDRFGARAVARAGTVVTALGFALAGAATGPALLVAGIVVIALGCSAAGVMPLTVAVVQAMPQRRTLALGLLPTGIALGGLAVPLVAWALDGMGWRATFVGVAIVTLVCGLVACAALPADRTTPQRLPASGGLDGPAAIGATEERHAVAGEQVRHGGRAPTGDHDLGSAVRTAAFWLLIAGHAAALVAVSAVNLHLVPLMTHHHGIPLATAGIAVALMSTGQLLGQVVTAVIGDHVDKRVLAAVCMVVHTGALVALATVSGVALVVLAAIVHGIAWGLRGPVMTALRADYFGVGSFGSIMGWSAGFVSIGLVAGPLLGSVLAGTNGYPVAFLVLAGITATGTIAFAVVRRPRGPSALAPANLRGEAAGRDPGRCR
ncbi:MAG TPA: MFS transporter [Pseudonocardia sp.]|nr:MFS transporter [Pseudonocardia sp.]